MRLEVTPPGRPGPGPAVDRLIAKLSLVDTISSALPPVWVPPHESVSSRGKRFHVDGYWRMSVHDQAEHMRLFHGVRFPGIRSPEALGALHEKQHAAARMTSHTHASDR